jgi:hypothetical protein
LLPGPASPSLLLLATRNIGFTKTRSDRIVVLLDRLWGPVGEEQRGFSDLFPQAAILVPYLEHSRILFICPPKTLYPRTNGGGIHPGRCAGVVRGCSLCGRLLVRTHAQGFGVEVLVLLDMRQLELETIYRLVPNLGAF